MSWNDFNNADDQNNFEVIRRGTIAKVHMTIKPGGYDDSSQGWIDGWATTNSTTGSVYLSCEFVVLEGKYSRRKLWGLIGLHSSKGPDWANMGRAFIKGILNSARGFCSDDNSPTAQDARRINSLSDLDGIEFLARIDVEKDQNGDDRNVIKVPITSDNAEYNSHMKMKQNATQSDDISDMPSWV